MAEPSRFPFSRAFRAAYDTSPSQFRKSGEIKKSKIRKELFSEGEYLLPMNEFEKQAAFPIEIVDFPEWAIAYIRVTNSIDGDRVRSAFKTMTDWAKSRGIFSEGTLFGMSIDDPSVTPKHLYRYEVCSGPHADRVDRAHSLRGLRHPSLGWRCPMF